MRVAFHVAEAVILLAAAVALSLSAGWLAGWLTAVLWRPVAVAVPTGVVLRLSRGRHPLWAVERWHGAAMRRLDGRG